MTVRIGIIGAGIMGADHAATLQRFVSGACVELVADVDLNRASTVADALGCRSSADPEGLVGDPEVDAVLVASHDSTHAHFIRACVAAGKPVLCEKPLSPSLAASAELLGSIGAGAELVSLGFMRRFDPGYTALRAAVAARTMGAPVLLHSVGRGVASAPGSTSESSITNSSVHDFDIVPWLLGSPVVEVSWHAPRRSSQAVGLQDPQLMLLRTADGVLSTVESFLNARYGYDIRCEVVGETGTASLAEPVRLVEDTARGRSAGYGADWRPRFAEAYRLETQAWVDALNARTPSPLASAHDGLVASAVADAVITSMHRGGVTVPVHVPKLAR
jgi:myo-inositol 2-dehydrogenase/D-chiro-inositol 1-dehydrogenase